MNLMEHPEGGRFREVFRSDVRVTTEAGLGRSALTHIYFRLGADEVSHFHRVNSDEVWNLYEGDGLYLYLWDGSSTSVERVELSGKDRTFCHVVPNGAWQAAVPMNDKILVGCSVAPGFEFADFEMMEPNSEEAVFLCAHHPELRKLVKPVRPIK